VLVGDGAVAVGLAGAGDDAGPVVSLFNLGDGSGACFIVASPSTPLALRRKREWWCSRLGVPRVDGAAWDDYGASMTS
jgi:hypothetical protein